MIDACDDILIFLQLEILVKEFHVVHLAAAIRKEYKEPAQMLAPLSNGLLLLANEINMRFLPEGCLRRKYCPNRWT